MKRMFIGFILCSLLILLQIGCVDQNQGEIKGEEIRIIATSPATCQVLDKLNLDLVGIPETSRDIPQRYKGLTVVGSPMSPDMEIVKSLKPTDVIGPNSLQEDLQLHYVNIRLNATFINLNSVQGMYKSIEDLGQKYNRVEEAKALTDEFKTYLKEFQKINEDKIKPKVLILMGFPGSYIVATENSYGGSLVQLAGGVNVYSGTGKSYLNVNTEDMSKKDPDIILRTAHALPQESMKMFDEEFQTNDIWKHFRAVKEGKVYDLDYEKFGMSAGFDYPEALEDLQKILYGN
ncbi:heme ABC transporter substrate-binding protein IsdE [Alkalibaculum sp. M08DMB]|uniref:High-affinity heme uptake system protein IsdE n=1 Tax=Alkalibaculum sporogenes TaxID=2655001 RepID=A0A6A7K4G0_9FIRM|nr:heme ABC transporter substrate-binding protein IsdE [Alkalibaculum sporogenes]MPW24261.1 heme ABC transporter substrate-binding protein IsdE [Alkalibaculum sporogenes]